MFEEFEIIHRYTRADALADGTLTDVSETAREAGIKFPTALTQAVWENFVRIPDGVEAQDEEGRLWDIVWLLRYAIIRSTETDLLVFTVFVRNDNEKARPVKLKATCGPGDDGSPCITIMLPDED